MSKRKMKGQHGAQFVPELSTVPRVGSKRAIWAMLSALAVALAVSWYSLSRPTLRSEGIPAAAARPDELGVMPTHDAGTTARVIREALDPRNDNWQTESFHETTAAQFKIIGKLLSTAEKPHPDQVRRVVATDFSCSHLRPKKLLTVNGDEAIVVRREGESPRSELSQTYSGAVGFADALDELGRPLASCSQIRVQFKQFRIDASETALTTSAYFHASGNTAGGSRQLNATWDCQWTHGSGSQPPRLSSIRVRDYEEVVARSESQTIFADCTEAVLSANPSYHEQLSYGTGYWLGRLEARYGNSFHSHHGLALGDVNGDGLEDLYVCQTGGLPNRLFLQQPDGTVRDDTARVGVDVLDFTRSALLVDLDNDGDQDLVVGTSLLLLIFANDGQGNVLLAGSPHKVPGAYSLAAADYDSDSDLDIYVCVYAIRDDDSQRTLLPVPYHDANNGLPNVLLRNDGQWTFTEATAETGMDVNNQRFSFAAAWEDYDNDGDVDLYVANDFGRNNLYRNNGGHFTDVAELTSVEDIAAGMSVTWGDYNHDGWMDLYVSNMFSAAGNRVAFQRRFHGQSDPTTRSLLQRHARGNSLFNNLGHASEPSSPAFHDVSVKTGVTMGRWAWGSLFADINNDGWEDLLVTNGYRTGDYADDL